MYKRIADIETVAEKDDILDELIDRFGEPPQSVCNLLDIALLKVKAHENFITAVAEKPGGVRITMYPQAEVAPEKIPPLVGEFGKRLRFVPDATPYFVYIPQEEVKQRVSYYMQENNLQHRSGSSGIGDCRLF